MQETAEAVRTSCARHAPRSSEVLMRISAALRPVCFWVVASF